MIAKYKSVILGCGPRAEAHIKAYEGIDLRISRYMLLKRKKAIRNCLQNLSREDCEHEFLDLNSESIELAEVYMEHGVLSSNYRDDARHIAMATVAGVDILASWNFRHVVHFDKIRQFNAVNLEKGYRTISIYSPREVTTYVSESS